MMYKIVDWKDGAPHTLFHGVNRCRKLPVGVWIEAEKKMVTDGSRQQPYLSGFHVMPTIEFCAKYLQRFTNMECKAIIPCEVHHIRPKPQASGPVFLADRIRI